MINISNQLLFHLYNLDKENIKLSYQQSTGNEIQFGSDNTNIFAKDLYYADRMRVYEGIEKQLKHTSSINLTQDSTMANIKKEMEKIKADMLKSLNSGMQPSDKKAIATTFQGIKENLLDWGNTKINGEYIFAGSDSTKPPFEMDADGNVTYVGDNSLKEVEVEPGSYRDRGITGFDAFMYTTSTARKGESITFSQSERVVDTKGNTWGFAEKIGAGEKLDFLPGDTVRDNNGKEWTVNALDGTLEDGDGASIKLTRTEGGFRFTDPLPSQFKDGDGNAVTSFEAVPPTPTPPNTHQLRQYDKYGNLTGETIGVTQVAPPDGAIVTETYFTTNNITNPDLTLEAKSSFFDDLDLIIDALNGVDPNDGVTPIDETKQNDIIRSMLDKVDMAFDAANVSHSQLGSRNKVINDAAVNVSAIGLNFKTLSIGNMKVDMAEVALEAKALELTYTAIYSSVSRLNQLSLVNFLR